jgi:paraquat-inducible protein B
MNWDANPPEIPIVPGGLQSLQDSVTALVEKLNKIPFEGIGKDLRQTLQSADTLLKTLDNSVAPEAKATLAAARTALQSANSTLRPDSAIAQSTADTMRELSRTAVSFRVLADYLERHPEALLRGKPEDQK